MGKTITNAPGVKKVFTVPLEPAWRTQACINKLEQDLRALLTTIAADNPHRPADQRIDSVTIKVSVVFPKGVTRNLVLPD